MFEGDQDIDIASDLNHALDGTELELSQMIFQTDHLAPQEARDFYKSPEYQPLLAETVANTREKLDSGLGDKLMAWCRANDSERGLFDGRYRTIVAGALIMRAGAKIKEEDVKHIREIVQLMNCNLGYAFPL